MIPTHRFNCGLFVTRTRFDPDLLLLPNNIRISFLLTIIELFHYILILNNNTIATKTNRTNTTTTTTIMINIILINNK